MHASHPKKIILLLFVVALATPLMAAEQERPNILFIFSDDHASHAISAYGSKINKTPNIDRLAKEGMLFENCFCTNSICAPSRAVIQTGKHSHINGKIDNGGTPFDGTQQTFPKLLQKAGYQTAIVGKWHLRSAPTGFDYWEVLFGQGPYYNPKFRTPDALNARQAKPVIGYTTDIITDKVLNFLQNKRDKKKPFMLMYQHKAPHRAWDPGPKHLTKYDGEKIYEPPTLFDDYKGRTSWAKKATMRIDDHMRLNRDNKLTPPPGLTKDQLAKWNAAYGPKNKKFKEANLKGKELTRWKYQRYIKDYLRVIASVDDNLGRVLKYLDDTGLAKNTVVIYTSDQGFYLGDHGWFDKRWMYEESLRMPLLVRWPGTVKAGSRNKDLVQNLDFAETFLEIAGVKVPGDMQGQSIVPLLKGETPKDWRKSIYYQYYEWYNPGTVHNVHRHYGVRTDRYKLIHYYLIKEWELFDLQKDPDELKSVYDDPKYKEVVSDLKAEVKRLRKHYKVDQFKEPPTRERRKRRNPKKVPASLALRFDGMKTANGRYLDRSEHKHHAEIVQAKLLPLKSGPAVQFNGKACLRLTPAPSTLDPSDKPMVVGARCNPKAKDGALIAHGGESLGYVLFLKDGVPHFAIRSEGELRMISAEKKIPLNQWSHVMGQLSKEGELSIMINGEKSGKSTKGHFIANVPADGFTVGADTGSHVGEYSTDFHFQGMLRDIRVYWGEPSEKELAAYATNDPD